MSVRGAQSLRPLPSRDFRLGHRDPPRVSALFPSGVSRPFQAAPTFPYNIVGPLERPPLSPSSPYSTLYAGRFCFPGLPHDRTLCPCTFALVSKCLKRFDVGYSSGSLTPGPIRDSAFSPPRFQTVNFARLPVLHQFFSVSFSPTLAVVFHCELHEPSLPPLFVFLPALLWLWTLFISRSASLELRRGYLAYFLSNLV